MKRATIIVGAGATLEIEGPSSQWITDVVKNSCVECLNKKGEILPLREVCCLLQDDYNFEDLFHIVEQLNSCEVGWSDKRKGYHKYRIETPLFSYLIRPIKKIKDYDGKTWNLCAIQILKTIATLINDYDKKLDTSRNGWYREFWKHFEKNADIITLNYDTTIERCLKNSIDGYRKKDGLFSAKLLLKKYKNRTTIAHLHGSIVLGQSKKSPNEHPLEDLVKYPNYEKAKEHWFNSSNQISSDSSQITISPIITGRMKAERILGDPFHVYYYHLQNSLLHNDNLLIIGYSFGDNYINACIKQFKKSSKGKIIIVSKYTKYPSSIDGGKRLRDWIDYKEDRSVGFLCDLLGEICSDNKNYFVSKDGRVYLFYEGFKNFANDLSNLSLFNEL